MGGKGEAKHMDKDFYQLKAYRDGVKAAKACGKPLSIWPGEKHLIALDDLPVVEPKFDVEKFERAIAIKTDFELRTRVEVGKRYALLSREVSKWGEHSVGEWKG